MKSLDRYRATLAGKPLEHCIVAPVLSLYGARLTGCPLERYYTEADAYARGQAAIYATLQPDILFAPFALAHIRRARWAARFRSLRTNRSTFVVRLCARWRRGTRRRCLIPRAATTGFFP